MLNPPGKDATLRSVILIHLCWSSLVYI